MDDPLSNHVEHILAMSGPFLDDNHANWDTHQCNRFLVYQINDDEHVTVDHTMGCMREWNSVIPSQELELLSQKVVCEPTPRRWESQTRYGRLTRTAHNNEQMQLLGKLSKCSCKHLTLVGLDLINFIGMIA